MSTLLRKSWQVSMLTPSQTFQPGEVWWNSLLLERAGVKELRDGWVESPQLLGEEEPIEVVEGPQLLLNTSILIKLNVSIVGKQRNSRK